MPAVAKINLTTLFSAAHGRAVVARRVGIEVVKILLPRFLFHLFEFNSLLHNGTGEESRNVTRYIGSILHRRGVPRARSTRAAPCNSLLYR